jgi:hypothetical protein
MPWPRRLPSLLRMTRPTMISGLPSPSMSAIDGTDMNGNAIALA